MNHGESSLLSRYSINRTILKNDQESISRAFNTFSPLPNNGFILKIILRIVNKNFTALVLDREDQPAGLTGRAR